MMLGKTGGRRRLQRLPWLDGINGHEFGKTLEDSEGQGGLSVLQSMGLQGVRRDSVTEQQQQNLIKVVQ